MGSDTIAFLAEIVGAAFVLTVLIALAIKGVKEDIAGSKCEQERVHVHVSRPALVTRLRYHLICLLAGKTTVVINAQITVGELGLSHRKVDFACLPYGCLVIHNSFALQLENTRVVISSGIAARAFAAGDAE